MENDIKNTVLKKAVVWKELYFYRKSDEEMANLLLTLCHQTDKMMCAYIKKLEERFVKESGIKERMYAARTGYRQQQDEYLRSLEAENCKLKAENAALRQKLEEILGNPWKSLEVLGIPRNF